MYNQQGYGQQTMTPQQQQEAMRRQRLLQQNQQQAMMQPQPHMHMHHPHAQQQAMYQAQQMPMQQQYVQQPYVAHNQPYQQPYVNQSNYVQSGGFGTPTQAQQHIHNSPDQAVSNRYTTNRYSSDVKRPQQEPQGQSDVVEKPKDIKSGKLPKPGSEIKFLTSRKVDVEVCVEENMYEYKFLIDSMDKPLKKIHLTKPENDDELVASYDIIFGNSSYYSTPTVIDLKLSAINNNYDINMVKVVRVQNNTTRNDMDSDIFAAMISDVSELYTFADRLNERIAISSPLTQNYLYRVDEYMTEHVNMIIEHALGLPITIGTFMSDMKELQDYVATNYPHHIDKFSDVGSEFAYYCDNLLKRIKKDLSVMENFYEEGSIDDKVKLVPITETVTVVYINNDRVKEDLDSIKDVAAVKSVSHNAVFDMLERISKLVDFPTTTSLVINTDKSSFIVQKLLMNRYSLVRI